MSGIFGGGKQPEVKPYEPPPQIAHEEVQAAGDAERRRRRQASGKGSTILTAGLGGTKANIGTSVLLGRG